MSTTSGTLKTPNLPQSTQSSNQVIATEKIQNNPLSKAITLGTVAVNMQPLLGVLVMLFAWHIINFRVKVN